MTPAVRPRGSASISLVGFIERSIAIWIWERARPETLPVPPLPDDLTPIRTEKGHPVLGPLSRILAWSLFVIAVIVAATASIEARATSALRERYLLSPGSMSLLEVAGQIEVGLSGSPVAWLYPDFAARTTRVAERIRLGTQPLERAAESYRTTAGLINELGLAGRLQMGSERVRPLAQALEQVRSIWHQETASFKDMQTALTPYLANAGKSAPPLRGVVKATTADHAVIFTLVSREGATLAETAALEAGGRFSLPIAEGATLVASALYRRPGEPYQVVEDLRVPLAVWSEKEMDFPRSSTTVQVEFDGEVKRMAPPFPPLSEAARKELGQ